MVSYITILNSIQAHLLCIPSTSSPTEQTTLICHYLACSSVCCHANILINSSETSAVKLTNIIINNTFSTLSK